MVKKENKRQKRVILSLLISVCVVLAMLPAMGILSVAAETNTQNETATDVPAAETSNGMATGTLDPSASTTVYKLPTDGDGSAQTTYNIATAADLVAFAAKVNSGNTAITGNLTANITCSGTWTPIGTASYPFNGTFNGNGHTISGLYVSNSSTTYVGLFGYIGSNGTVQNVGVINSTLKGGNYVGGIAGQNAGKIINCYSTATVGIATSSGGGSFYSITVDNASEDVVAPMAKEGLSMATGALDGISTSIYSIGDDDYPSTPSVPTKVVGGLVGYMTGGSVSYSYNTGSVETSSSNYNGGIVGYKGNGTVTNCYTQSGSTSYGGTTKSAAQFKSGEVAYLLNNNSSSGVWKQTLNGSNYPSFTGGTVYYANGSYTNTTFVPGADGYYAISNASQLNSFAQLVNSGNTTIKGKLTANISCSGTWTPIGTSYAFNGIFDGQGHTISGLNVTSGNNVGLFGIIGSNGTVQNVGVINSTLKGGNYVGGIAGQSAGRIINCYSTATVGITTSSGGGSAYYSVDVDSISGNYDVAPMAKEGLSMATGTLDGISTSIYNIPSDDGSDYPSAPTKVVGGLVGYMTGGSVSYSYNTGSVETSSSNYNGGIVGYKSSGSVTNCYTQSGSTTYGGATKSAAQFKSGEVTYLLNNNSSSGVWKQTLNGSNYPSFTGGIVYYGYGSYDANGFASGTTYANSALSTCIYEKPAMAGSGYQITKPGHLFWFAGLVNGNLSGVAQNASASATLTVDITVPSGKTWTPIGNSSVAFNGTFSGNGHTVSGLNVTSGDCVGLIGNLGANGTVKLVGVINSTLKGSNVGGIVGKSAGTVIDCYSTASVSIATSSGGGSAYYSVDIDTTGISEDTVVPMATEGLSMATGTLDGFSTSVYGDETPSATTKAVGGIVGYMTAGSVTNCYYTGSADNGIVGNKSAGTVSNCYTTVGATNGATLVTAAQMASGEVAFKLGDNFGQQIGVQNTPVLGGYLVYEIKDIVICSGKSTIILVYSNTYREPVSTSHHYVDDTCTICGAHKTVADECVKLNGYELSLGGSLGLKFRLELDSHVDLNTAFAEITVNNSLHPRTDKIYLKDAEVVTVDGKTYYVVSADVNAKEMTNEVGIEVTVNGKTFRFTYSVKEYANFIIANENADDYYKAASPLVKAMLTYGGASQRYFQYDIWNKETIADNGIADVDLSNITAETLKQYDIPNAKLDFAILYAASLRWESDVIVKIYFYTNPSYTLSYSYNGKQLETYTETLKVGGRDRTMTVVEITGIEPKNWAKDIEIVISDGTNQYPVKYNMMTYCYEVLKNENSKPELVELVKSMYRYHQEVLKYFS